MYAHLQSKRTCIFHIIYIGKLHSKVIKEVLVTLAYLVTTYDSLLWREI
jgi:hypothetical protein